MNYNAIHDGIKKNETIFKTAIHYDPILYIKIESITPKY